MSGGIASDVKTDISRRETFLNVDFERVWEVRRVSGQNAIRKSFRLAYAPDGLGMRYWDIRVTLSPNSGLEFVSLAYRVPAPF